MPIEFKDLTKGKIHAWDKSNDQECATGRAGSDSLAGALRARELWGGIRAGVGHVANSQDLSQGHRRHAGQLQRVLRQRASQRHGTGRLFQVPGRHRRLFLQARLETGPGGQAVVYGCVSLLNAYRHWACCSRESVSNHCSALRMSTNPIVYIAGCSLIFCDYRPRKVGRTF